MPEFKSTGAADCATASCTAGPSKSRIAVVIGLAAVAVVAQKPGFGGLQVMPNPDKRRCIVASPRLAA